MPLSVGGQTSTPSKSVDQKVDICSAPKCIISLLIRKLIPEDKFKSVTVKVSKVLPAVIKSKAKK
jgi:hypothetical protein